MIDYKQDGFVMLELIIASAIAVMLATISGIIMNQMFSDNRNINDQLVAGYQIDRAGYWISRDTQMADFVITQGLVDPVFLVLEWTDWGINTDSISYTVTYSIMDTSDNIGTLTRHFQNSDGADETVRIAGDIYYNVQDLDESTSVNYTNGLLTLNLTTKVGLVQHQRTYTIYPRPNYIGQ